MCAVRVIDPSRSVPRYSTAASDLPHDLPYILKSRAASLAKFLEYFWNLERARNWYNRDIVLRYDFLVLFPLLGNRTSRTTDTDIRYKKLDHRIDI